MQLRISSTSAGTHFNGNILHPVRRSKQQTFFTYNKQQIPHSKHDITPHNVYYDNNPYFLHGSPSEPRIKGIMSNSRHSSHSRDHNQTSSQRSCKVVRANGLKLVQKPKILRQKLQMAMHTNPRLSEPNRKLYQQNFQLESQNKVLKQENQGLRLQLMQMQEVKNRQIAKLNQRIQGLAQMAIRLQQTMHKNQAQWKQCIKQLREK